MKRPTVRQTHAICDSLNARAVIILAFSEDGIAGASYGETKRECQQVGYTLDNIVEALEGGLIPVWATPDRAQEERRAQEEGDWCHECKTPLSCCNCDRELAYIPESE
jgi:hypothetical protein